MNPDSLRIVREGVNSAIDPADEFGIEAALQLVEKHGGSVVVVSMGPTSALDAIRKGLAMGAEKGILISDPALAGSDALTTARVLAAAIKRESPDLVICATESTDAYTGMVPGGIAQSLDMPQLTFAKQLSVDGTRVTVQRQTENGYQRIVASLPAVVTVTASIATPRYPALKGIMQAKKKPVDQLTAADLGFAPDQVGQTGAVEKVLSWSPAEARKAGRVVQDDGSAAGQIADYLAQLKVI